MSVGNQLQEMDNVVTKNAKPGDPMQKLAPGAVAGQTGGWEDLGGPTPQNSKPTDGSNALKTPGKTLKQVSDVVTKSAKPAMAKEEEEWDEDQLLEAAESEEDEEDEKEEEDEKGGKKKKEMKEETDSEEEEEEEEGIEFNVEEDVKAIFGDEEFSEEFKERTKVVFEAALRSKVNEAAEIIAAKYEEALEENVAQIKHELTERVDSYLEYVSTEWLEENALQVETGLKSELSESFMTGLKGLFEDHYVSIPEDKYNVLESMVQKLDEMETKLNEQIERNVALNRRLSESVSDGIFAEVSEGLAYSQRDKLASLAEGVEFESEEDYREKLETLREAYFPRNPVAYTEDDTLSEEAGSEVISESMSKYLSAVTKFSK